MEAVQLEAQLRKKTGKGEARRLRAQGLLPCVLYGKEVENRALQVSAKELDKIIREAGENTLIKLVVTGDGVSNEYTTILREVQRHPLKGTLTHADFYRISLTEKLETVVPIQLVGQAQGVAHGGILQHGVREVEIKCLPTEIPEALEVDVTGLGIGDNLTVGEITPPAGVEIISDLDTIVATVVAPRLEEEAAPEEEAAVPPVEEPAAEETGE